MKMRFWSSVAEASQFEIARSVLSLFCVMVALTGLVPRISQE